MYYVLRTPCFSVMWNSFLVFFAASLWPLD